LAGLAGFNFYLKNGKRVVQNEENKIDFKLVTKSTLDWLDQQRDERGYYYNKVGISHKN